MTINLKMPDITELKPKITVFGIGGAGGNAVNNMIECGLKGVEFVVANTDAQALTTSAAERLIQMGVAVTEGLGAGSQPEVGRAAAEEALDEINDHLGGAHMVFITAGMGGGTGTGSAPVIAQAAREMGILTVGVVTKPFDFEGKRRMRVAEAGIESLQEHVDTLIVIPNQNLFRIANERTTFAEAFTMADQVLYSGVACITDLMVKEGLINLDFADVRAVMRGMGKAMMGTGESSGDNRAVQAAEAAIANPLLDDTSMHGARGLLISITGGNDLTLFEVDEAATRIREEVDPEANIILGATFDESLEGVMRVSVVATGIDQAESAVERAAEQAISELSERLKKRTTHEQPAPRKPEITSEIPSELFPSEPEEPIAPQHAEEPAPAPSRPAEPRRVSDSGVEITRLEPGRYAPPQAEASRPETAETPQPSEEREFVPPMAEHPERRAPRMPKVEDFPLIAQKEFRARGRGSDDEEGPRKPGLFQRLANVGGLSRRDDDDAALPPPPATMARPQQAQPEPEPVSEFARRPQKPAQAPESAPRHSPQVASAPRRQGPAAEEDPYDIPAFLRRQAN